MFISDSIYSLAFAAPSDTHDEKLAASHASEVLAAITIQVKKILDGTWEVVVRDTKDGEEPDCAFKRTKIIFA